LHSIISLSPQLPSSESRNFIFPIYCFNISTCWTFEKCKLNVSVRVGKIIADGTPCLHTTFCRRIQERRLVVKPVNTRFGSAISTLHY
jgi:hypothetical protein